MIPRKNAPTFYFNFAKDVCRTFATLGAVLATQWGIYNSCSCWSKENEVYLPQLDPVAGTLVHRAGSIYPAIAFAFIGVQLLLIPSLLGYQYFQALQVFVRRDVDKANIQRLQNLRCWWYFRAANTTQSAHEQDERLHMVELQHLTTIDSAARSEPTTESNPSVAEAS